MLPLIKSMAAVGGDPDLTLRKIASPVMRRSRHGRGWHCLRWIADSENNTEPGLRAVTADGSKLRAAPSTDPAKIGELAWAHVAAGERR